MGVETKKVKVEHIENKYTITCDYCGKLLAENSNDSGAYFRNNSKISASIKYLDIKDSSLVEITERYRTPQKYILCEKCKKKLVDEILSTISKLKYLEKSDSEVF